MKVIIKFTEGLNLCKWMKQLLEIQEKQGFVKAKSVSTHVYVIKEKRSPEYLISSDWVNEVIEE